MLQEEKKRANNSMPRPNSALEERLNGLETMSRYAFTRLEALMAQIDDRLRMMETSTLSDVAVQRTKLEAAWKKMDEHQTLIDGQQETLKEHEKYIQRTKPLVSAVIWLSGAFGLLVVTLIWGLITGQVGIHP